MLSERFRGESEGGVAGVWDEKSAIEVVSLLDESY